MGGRALGIETIRLNQKDYHEVFDSLKILIPEVELIPSYHSKPDFGDMDVLYRKGYINKDSILSDLNEHYFLKGYVENGDVLSVGILMDVPYSKADIFQIDFIGSPPEFFNFAYNYFSYNDMGNLFGRVARSIDLKFGHKGLFYVQRDGDHVLKEHLLTNMFSTALYHLGYDAERFYQGFDTLEEIFEYIMTSRFYDFNKFDLKQRNRKARIRDEKRPNYRAFLEYATANPKVNRMLDSMGAKTYSFGAFPEFYRDYFIAYDQNELHKKFKLKYNGELIMRLTGLKGKELGEFMQWMKPKVDKDHVMNIEREELDNYILSLYEQYKTGKSDDEV